MARFLGFGFLRFGWLATFGRRRPSLKHLLPGLGCLPQVAGQLLLGCAKLRPRLGEVLLALTPGLRQHLL